MPREQALSPRQEALAAIEAVRRGAVNEIIDSDAWAKIVGLAWDARNHISRRDVQSDIRDVLLAAVRRSA